MKKNENFIILACYENTQIGEQAMPVPYGRSPYLGLLLV
jgi:hypothetical protein